MTVEPGLRERKKRRARQAILDAAWRLFKARGFDGVSVAEVAEAAEVSKATVFNYFPAKEDLVFGALATFEEDLLAAVRARPMDETVVGAFGRLVVGPAGRLAEADSDAVGDLAAAGRLIGGSRTLLARERELWDEYTANLAILIAAERGLTGEDLEPWVLANALLGVQRALVADVRKQAIGGMAGPAIADRVERLGRRAISALEHGLASVEHESPHRADL